MGENSIAARSIETIQSIAIILDGKHIDGNLIQIVAVISDGKEIGNGGNDKSDSWESFTACQIWHYVMN